MKTQKNHKPTYYAPQAGSGNITEKLLDIGNICKGMIFLIILFLPSFALSQSEMTYATEDLAWLFKEYNLGRPAMINSHITGDDFVTERRVTVRHNSHTLPIRILFVDSTLVTHIGLDFFSTQERQVLSPIDGFLERYLLVLNARTAHQQSADLTADNVQMLYNGKRFGEPGFTEFNTALNVIRNRTDLNLINQDLKFLFTCKDQQGNVLHLALPARFDVISGMDKIELESTLALRLQHLSAPPESFFGQLYEGINPLVVDTLNILKTQNPDFVPGLNQNTFYQKVGNRYVLERSTKFPLQSLTNQLLRPSSNDRIQLRGKFMRYSNQDSYFVADYSRLLYLLGQDHDIYIGFEEEKGNVMATLVFVNRYFHHLHMLSIDNVQELLRNSTNVTTSATLYSYIRNDNVEDLFAPYIEGSGRKIPVTINNK